MEISPFFGNTTVNPRDYQERLCQKVVRMFRGEERGKDGELQEAVSSVLIEAPTGAGKTVMAMGLAQWAAAQNPDARIAVVAMRRNLLHQANETREKFGFNIPNIFFVSMFDKDPPKDIDLLIIDEAHHDSTTSMAHIHAQMKPKLIVGLTATPFRSDKGYLPFERTVRDVGIHTLIREGYLSKFNHYTVDHYTPESVTGLYLGDRAKWGKSTMFFLTSEECDEAAAALRQGGVRCEVVKSGTPRQEQIRGFTDGDTDVLISMGLLTEGFDAPCMKTVFIRPSGRLPTVQMAGRVLRLDRTMPVKQMVQCKDTHYPFLRVAPAENSFAMVDGEFLSLRSSVNVENTVQDSIRRVLSTDVELPRFLGGGKKTRVKVLRAERRRGD